MAITNILDLSLINLPDGSTLPKTSSGTTGKTTFNINDFSSLALYGNDTVLKTINGKRFIGLQFKSNANKSISIFISDIDGLGNPIVNNNMNIGDEIIVGFRINYLLEGDDLLTKQIPTSLTIEDGSYEQIWDGDPNRAYVEIHYVKTGASKRTYTIYANKEIVKTTSGNVTATSTASILQFRTKSISNTILPTPVDSYLGISDIYLAYNKVTDQNKTGLIGPLTVKHTFVKDLITTGNWTDKSGSNSNVALKNAVSKPTVFNSNPSTADYIKTDESGGSLKLTFEKPQVQGNLLGAQIIMGASRPTHSSAEMVVKTFEEDKLIEEKTHNFPRLPDAEKRIIHTIDPGPDQTFDPSVIEKLSLEINSKMVKVDIPAT